jgi:hypothetical protein
VYGTAFLIIWKDRLFVLTNNHVLPTIAAAEVAILEFRAVKPIVRVKLAPQILFHTSSRNLLDYSIVAIASHSLPALSHIQPLALATEPLVDELSVQIIGFPKGWLHYHFIFSVIDWLYH